MVNIVPVILCGGSGTRLWPLSRKARPKQFTRLAGEETLFQAAARRVAPGGAGGCTLAPPVIVTGSDFRFLVAEQLAALGIAPGAIVIEPAARNTAPAIAVAALHVAAQDPQALLLVLPSDHAIADVQAFRAAVAAGAAAAAGGAIVTFGTPPERADTGLGYLVLGAARGEGPLPVERFVEKPGPEAAAALLAGGGCLWNAGMFLLGAQTAVHAFAAHAPEVLGLARAALAGARSDLDFLRLAAGPWREMPDISFDYAIMEKAAGVRAVPLGTGWSDLGTWQAVWREGTRGADDVGTSGRATAIDCAQTLLRSENPEVEIVGIGLRGIVAVATKDAVLVAPMERAQEVRGAVERLAARAAPQATRFALEHRPWGSFETLAEGERFKVKRIHVHPGAALSLQSHHHRAEHWTVVQGTAAVTIDAQRRLLTENESVYVPLGVRHRLENPGKLPVTLIEVQTGAYLGEDDIERYEDVYAREAGE